MNLSTLEIQSIIEQSFLPSICTCSMAPDQSLTIRVCDCMTGKVDLVASHVRVWELDSAYAIATLVAQMQQEINAHKGVLPTFSS
ncbi:Protein of unknown function (DUF1652) [Pseudomonas sp. GM21]|jgi:hypothetical protein|uniref:DUF1652 domain-containing protein n=1 Tax=Pseudomonas sp. GM21 TaxID=1144325 RepID=UPI0002727F6C|nr:DUF1652 domain-containing protein [Pseudomonas sp. GM21]EJM23981.1 Protein of unknown function (DUF1652) [Pseudomonas sp. GM21]